MSGPKTTTFSLSDEVSLPAAVAGGAVGGAASLVTAALDRLAEERRRIEAERGQRMADQRSALEAGELKWRVERAFAKVSLLTGEIRSWQQRYPEMVNIPLMTDAPPVGASIEALRSYLEKTNSSVKTARQQLDDAMPGLQSRGALESLVSGIDTTGRPRSATDVLSPLMPHASHAEKDLQENDTLTMLRERTAEAVRRFIDQEQVLLPEELADQIARLYVIRDETEAAGMALSVRDGLEQAQVQLERERQEAGELIASLSQLPATGKGVAEVCARLRAVLDHKDRLGAELRESAKLIREAEQEKESLRNEAAAIILRDAFADMGYEVEPIENTLFVKGGTVHFRKPGWGQDYFVRMRLDAHEDKMNFNVVRVASDEAGAVDTTRKDIAAENTWCAEFDKFQDVLKSRGIDMKTVRRLGPGDVPVQKVRADAINRDAIQQAAEQRISSHQCDEDSFARKIHHE